MTQDFQVDPQLFKGLILTQTQEASECRNSPGSGLTLA
jgi:hypothetical protein